MLFDNINKIDRDGEIYANCMAELKGRLLKTKTSPDKVLKGIFYLEFICLQFRKICELFAFGTLIANRKLYEQIRKDFGNDWNFVKILEIVEKINPKFFPEPLKYEGNKQFIGKSNVFLQKKDIINIYKDCSDLIHAQNHYKNLKEFYPQNDTELDGWQKKFDGWREMFVGLFILFANFISKNK